MTKKLSPTVKTLKKAKKVLEENKWVRNTYARKANGQTEVNPTDPSAKCFCALGAVAKAIDFDIDLPACNNPIQALFNDVESVLNEAVEKSSISHDFMDEFPSNKRIDNYNDYVAKNKKDVLKMFDKAIELASKSSD